MTSSSEQSPVPPSQDDYPDIHIARTLPSPCAATPDGIDTNSFAGSAPISTRSDLVNRVQRTKSLHDASETCRVCGDGHARMHYGVLTCFGCKGFFRRTLKRSTEYKCRHQESCIVDRHERNSCRYCRFKRCLEVGMDPKAVRPDRDATGRHYQTRARRTKMFSGESSADEATVSDDWSRKLSVDMRTTLMQLLNVDLMVNNGDSNVSGKEMYPLPFTSLRQILDDPSLLDGKRTEMRYEPYRKLSSEELIAVAHRRLIAIIDWVDHLFDIMELHGTEDKVTLVKSGFAPLTIFSFAAATAKSTKERDIMCLCNFGFVPRDVHRVFDEPYHLANRIIERSLDELVDPFRALHLKDEEIVLLKAIIVLNPHIKVLSQEASEQIADLRDRIQEALYHVVRETHPKEVASSRFGNLLLFLPSIMVLGNVMYENLQFVQSFGKQNVDPLLCELLDNIEPVDDDRLLARSSRSFFEVVPSSIHQSASCSSISSLTSHTSASSNESATPSEDTHCSESESRRSSISLSNTPSSLSSVEHAALANACSLPNLDQMPNTVAESDPDYNVTLTPEMFTGMRQALSAAQSMDVDDHATPPNSPEFGFTPAPTPRPQFFIEEKSRTVMVEPAGSRHKFTVTTRGSSEDSEEYVRAVNEMHSPYANERTAVPQTAYSTHSPLPSNAIPIANGSSSPCNRTVTVFGSFTEVASSLPNAFAYGSHVATASLPFAQRPTKLLSRTNSYAVEPAGVSLPHVVSPPAHVNGVAFEAPMVPSPVHQLSQPMEFDAMDFY